MKHPKIIIIGSIFKEEIKKIQVANHVFEIIKLSTQDDFLAASKNEDVLFLALKDYAENVEVVTKVVNVLPNLPIILLPCNYCYEKSKVWFHNIIFGIVKSKSHVDFTILREKELEGIKGKGADIRINFFGELQIKSSKDEVLSLNGSLITNLTAYLFYKHKKRIHQDQLIGMFWDGYERDNAKGSLRVHIFNLKKQLKEKLKIKKAIKNEAGFYSFSSELTIQTDVDVFLENYNNGLTQQRKGNREEAIFFFQNAIETYKGDFMEGFLQEDWFLFERRKWKEKYLEILFLLATWKLEEKDFSSAKHFCHLILEKEKSYEVAHGVLIQIFIEQGQRGKAIRQYKIYEQVLEKEFGVKPSVEIKGLLGDVASV